jgi:hypothetical protein
MLGTSKSPDGVTVVGESYVELSPGTERATLWEVESDDTITAYDLNDETFDLPPGITLSTYTPDDMHGFWWTAGARVGGTRVSSAGASSGGADESARAAGPGGTPHAYVLTSEPVDTPAVSLFGIAGLAGLLVLVGALICRRAPAFRRTPESSI